LDSSGRKDGHRKVSNGRNGKEKELIDRKTAHVGKGEGLYSGIE
jgi:hypothetical protein